MPRKTSIPARARLTRKRAGVRAPAHVAPLEVRSQVVVSELLVDMLPSGLKARRSAEAIETGHQAHKVAGTPPTDFLSRALQPGEVQRISEAAEALREPGPIEMGAGEAVPSLGNKEPYDGARHTMVDTLQRPTTISVRASEKRLELLYGLGLLQSGVELAATHTAAMNLLGFMPGLRGRSNDRPQLPAAEVARLGNTAARLMDAFTAGAEALCKMKRGCSALMCGRGNQRRRSVGRDRR